MEFISVQICLAETDSKLLNKSYIYSVNWGRAAISPFSIFEALNGIWIFNSC